MREALDSPVPVTGLSITAFAAPMMGTRPKASVLIVVEIDGQALKFKQDGALFANNIEDGDSRDGRERQDSGQRQGHRRAQAACRKRTRWCVKNGVRLTRRLALTPGSLPVADRRARGVGGLVGSVMYDLDVPDFSKADLSMGGLLLTAVSADRMPTANPDRGLQGDPAELADRSARVPLRRSADAGG